MHVYMQKRKSNIIDLFGFVKANKSNNVCKSPLIQVVHMCLNLKKTINHEIYQLHNHFK